MIEVNSARRSMRSLSAEQRTTVYRLANNGEQHPDPAIAAIAYEWSHGAQWDRLSNRLPGWLLPLAGLVVVAGLIAAGVADMAPVEVIVVMIAASLVVVVMGALGWMSSATARTLRTVYPTPPHTARDSQP